MPSSSCPPDRAQDLVRSADATLWRDMVEAAPDALVAADDRGRIVLANGQAERLLGWAREDLVGRPVETLVPEALRAAHVGHRAAYQLAPHARPMGAGLELWARRRDGTALPVEISLSPLPTPGGTLVLAAVRDVTAQRRAAARLGLLAEAATLLASTTDYDRTLQAVARLAVPALADVAALDLVDEAGRLARRALAHADPAEDAALQRELGQAPLVLARATPVTRVLAERRSLLVPAVSAADLDALAQDAGQGALWRRLAPRSLLAVPLVARDRALGVLVLAYTAADRRHDADDRQVAEVLAGRLALALDNARLYQETQRALAARDAFLAAVSHDLRNPLALIRMIAQALGPKAADDALRDGLADIDRAVGRSDAMVEQLLDVARLAAGQPLSLRRRPTELVALARRVAADQARTAGPAIAVAATVPTLDGVWDDRRLERALENLVHNARKYTRDGAVVTVTLGREAGADGAFAVVAVADRGIGIPAADLPRLGQPFRRAGNVGGIAGTGVGLASARQVAEQHGGGLTLESAEGVGTTATLRLPLDPPDDAGEPV